LLTFCATVIQCDEGQPTCRNCVKSKRECLGYDPMFKTQVGPSNIQPAPNSTPTDTPTNSASFPTPPPGYSAAASSSHPRSASADSPTSSSEAYEYGAAIDPALNGSALMANSGRKLTAGTAQTDGETVGVPIHKGRPCSIPSSLLRDIQLTMNFQRSG